MSYQKSNLVLIVSALAIGGITYFYLGQKSDQAARAVDQAVEVIARETNQRPKTEADLQENIAAPRNVASIDLSEYAQHQNKLSAFSASKFDSPSMMFAQVDSLSMDILKSNLTIEKKSALNADLHELASKKLTQLNPPKVVSTKLDLTANIVYPVFETK